MVQKRPLLRQRPIILVTVGTTYFGFTRVLEAVDFTLIYSKAEHRVITQTGTDTFKWYYKDVEYHPFIAPDEYINLVKKATKIITHAGPGTLYTIARYSSVMPLVIPRLKKYGEHVTNHQLVFSKYIRKQLPNSHKKYLLSDTDISEAIKRYIAEKPTPNILSRVFHAQPSSLLMQMLEKTISKWTTSNNP